MPFRNIRNPRPCQRCRKLHIRCIASPNSESCQKCLRHKWDCVPVNPLRSMPRSVRKQQSSVPKAAVPAAPSPSSSSSCSTPDTVHSDLSSSPSVAPLYPEWQAHYERDSSHHLQFPSFSSSPEYLEPSNLRSSWEHLPSPHASSSHQGSSWLPESAPPARPHPTHFRPLHNDLLPPPLPCELFFPQRTKTSKSSPKLPPSYHRYAQEYSTHPLYASRAVHPPSHTAHAAHPTPGDSPLCVCLDAPSGQCFCSPHQNCGCAMGRFSRVHCYNTR